MEEGAASALREAECGAGSRPRRRRLRTNNTARVYARCTFSLLGERGEGVVYLVFSRPLRALPTLEHLQTNSLELAHRAQLRTRVTAPQQYSSTYEVHCCGGGRHHPYAASSRLLGTQAPCVNARHPPTGVACHQRAEYVPRLPRARTRRSRGERAHITMQQPAGGAGFLTLEARRHIFFSSMSVSSLDFTFGPFAG